ncbi:MAG TPA: lipopolysaccharide kinase InaA family protein [Gemmatimonadaceae bacterium]
MRIHLPGYARLTTPGAAGIVLEGCRTAIESIVAGQPLYDFAAAQPAARRFTGRAPVYAITLSEECGDVVVRRSMRGGALARLRTDLFFPPTRGLRELVTSLRLRRAGVQTPEMIGFIVYRVGPVFRRTDVVTREIKGGTDLASALRRTSDTEQRLALFEASAQLVAMLSRAGAHHSDLNARNILVTGIESAIPPQPQAYLLDVDRVRFHIPGDPVVLSANIARLARSMRKLRDRGELKIEDSEIERLRARVLELAA